MGFYREDSHLPLVTNEGRELSNMEMFYVKSIRELLDPDFKPPVLKVQEEQRTKEHGRSAITGFAVLVMAMTLSNVVLMREVSNAKDVYSSPDAHSSISIRIGVSRGSTSFNLSSELLLEPPALVNDNLMREPVNCHRCQYTASTRACSSCHSEE